MCRDHKELDDFENTMDSRPWYREEVYAAVDKERRYQDEKHGDENRDLGSLILLTDAYLDKTKAAFARPAGRHKALDYLRKVTALAVLAQEKHGVFTRAPYESLNDEIPF